jgi:hypothetical protein
MVSKSLLNNLNTYANLIVTYDNNLQFLPTAASDLYRAWTTPTSWRDLDAIEIDSSYAPASSKEREICKRKGLCFKCRKYRYIS